jgi:UDP-glucuronate 4-epimerase
MAILVTGGAGFIGSHLIERLLQTTDEAIVSVDALTPDYDPALKRRNLEGFANNDRVTILETDFSDADAMTAALEEHAITRIAHIGALAGVRQSVSQPFDYQKSNVQGTLGMLEAARRKPVEKFVLISSSTVYGQGASSPFVEDAPLGTPLSPYGASKRSAELFGLTYHYLHKVPVVCLRPFSVHGPRLRPDLAVAIFTRAIDTRETFTLFGDGEQRRDFTHVSDICAGIHAALDGTNVAGECINLGFGRPVSIKHVIEVIEEAVGKKANIIRKPFKPEDMPETFADLTKARRLLNYEPHVSFEDGLRDYVRWFLEQPTH